MDDVIPCLPGERVDRIDARRAWVGRVVRQAKLQDAVNIFELVNSLSGDGTLLRRSYAEICENVRDFAVAESESRRVSRLRRAAPIWAAPG